MILYHSSFENLDYEARYLYRWKYLDLLNKKLATHNT